MGSTLIVGRRSPIGHDCGGCCGDRTGVLRLLAEWLPAAEHQRHDAGHEDDDAAHGDGNRRRHTQRQKTAD